MIPDTARDIVVHGFTLVDALTGDAVGERWSVWLGRDSEGSFESESEALAVARRLAEETGREIWLERDNRFSRLTGAVENPWSDS